MDMVTGTERTENNAPSVIRRRIALSQYPVRTVSGLKYAYSHLSIRDIKYFLIKNLILNNYPNGQNAYWDSYFIIIFVQIVDFFLQKYFFNYDSSCPG